MLTISIILYFLLIHNSPIDFLLQNIFLLLFSSDRFVIFAGFACGDMKHLWRIKLVNRPSMGGGLLVLSEPMNIEQLFLLSFNQSFFKDIFIHASNNYIFSTLNGLAGLTNAPSSLYLDTVFTFVVFDMNWIEHWIPHNKHPPPHNHYHRHHHHHNHH